MKVIPKKVWVVLAFILLLGLIGVATSSTQQSIQTDKVVSKENIETNTPTPASQSRSLTHSDLLKIANSEPHEVVNHDYTMTLYLEQHPTDTQAEFMSQPDDNSLDTILITCNMNATDLSKLDGTSAQNRNYKAYDLNVTFTKYDSNVDLYYVADCSLK